MTVKEFIKKIFFIGLTGLFLFNIALSNSTYAATTTWTGAGTDNLASNPQNWLGNTAPQYGDDVVFNSTSSKDCTWDLNVSLSSFAVKSGYTGKVTKISDATLTIAKSFISPNAPAGLTAIAVSSSQINLSWTDNSNNEAGFKVERKAGIGGTYTQIASVGANVTAHSDTGLTAGTAYYYRVMAYNSFGDSVYSNEANTATISVNSPTVTANSVTNVNGSAVTLNASVNPNGAETTVYFEWGPTTSYGNTTPAQPIGNGTNNVNVTVYLAGLLPNTVYHYRIVAVNAGGTASGNDISFTTPSITLTTISPSDGITINRPDVMVRGTITNMTGDETGVTVNGVVAIVYGNQFIANHVPLEEGLNTIAVTATDVAGKAATTSITVNAFTTAPHVILTANITSGIVPFITYFSVSTEIPNAVAAYQVDFEGDGTIDYTGNAFDNISFTYAEEGIYYPTVIVRDDQGTNYSDTIAIVVLNAAQLDALLKSKWNGMKNSLSIKNTATALTYMHSAARASYQEMFNALIDQLPSIVATETEFKLIFVADNVAKYELVTIENGERYSYEVIFIKDETGLWKILEF